MLRAAATWSSTGRPRAPVLRACTRHSATHATALPSLVLGAWHSRAAPELTTEPTRCLVVHRLPRYLPFGPSPALHSVHCLGCCTPASSAASGATTITNPPRGTHHATPTSHARDGPPPSGGIRRARRPMLSTPLSEGELGGRACPLASPGNPARWGATSCRSKAAPVTDRMRWRWYDTLRTFASHPPTWCHR